MSEIFVANQPIILFAYGEVFFVLGLAIALQSWRHSQLALARDLRWLAAFGITHGLHEWGLLFVPIQAEILQRPVVEFLIFVQAILLVASFVALFEFGVRVAATPGRAWRMVALLPGVALAVWILLAVGPVPGLSRGAEDWQRMMSIAARYLMCLPGGLMAGHGLWVRAREVGTELDVPRVARTLRVASLALAAYALLAGIVVPPASFFPASRINTLTLMSATGVPVELFRSGVGLVMAVAVIRSLEIFRVELDRRILAIEEARASALERERIGRELHDHSLQKVYAAGLLLAAARRRVGADDDTARLLDRTEAMLDDAVADIRVQIGGQARPSSLRDLGKALEGLATDPNLRSMVDVEVEHDLREDIPLTPQYADHLLAIASEATSNAARHSGASRVQLRALRANGAICLTVSDDGRGLPRPLVPGHGLRNMRDRARLMGGRLAIDSTASGTTLSVEVPWPPEEDSHAAADRR